MVVLLPRLPPSHALAHTNSLNFNLSHALVPRVQVGGFIEKNNDTMYADLAELMEASPLPLLREMFGSTSSSTTTAVTSTSSENRALSSTTTAAAAAATATAGSAVDGVPGGGQREQLSAAAAAAAAAVTGAATSTRPATPQEQLQLQTRVAFGPMAAGSTTSTSIEGTAEGNSSVKRTGGGGGGGRGGPQVTGPPTSTSGGTGAANPTSTSSASVSTLASKFKLQLGALVSQW